MAFSTSSHRLLQDLILQSGNRDRSLLPVLLRYIDPAQWLGLVLSILEPLIELSDISRGVLFILFAGNAVYPRAGILSQTSECRIQRFGRDKVSDGKELPLPIFLG